MSPPVSVTGTFPYATVTMLFVAVVILFFIFLVWLHILTIRDPRRPPQDDRTTQATPVRRLLPLPSYPGEGPPDRWPGGDGGAAGGGRGDAGDGGVRAADEEYQPEDLDELFGAIEQEQ